MTHEETTALVRRANASGFESIADYAVSLEAEAKRLGAALDDLLEGAEDMRGYVPEYFAQKWHHDEALARARGALDVTGRFGSCGGVGSVRVRGPEDYGVSFESEHCESCGGTGRDIDGLNAEVERLRLALQRIADQGPELTNDWRHWSFIARAALDAPSIPPEASS